MPILIIIASAAVLLYLPDIGPERYTDLDSLFSHERHRQANAGFLVAVCRNGNITYSSPFGKDGSGQPLSYDTPMYLGPTSEILSGALLRSMSYQKIISLDEDISFYLPELQPLPENGPGVRRANSDAVSAAAAAPEGRITLRQLASHSADMKMTAVKEYETRISGLEAGELPPDHFFSQLLSNAASPRSRIAYRILGAAMENAGRDTFDELLQRNLLIPLGMHGTTSRPDSLQGVATGSGLFFGLAFPYDSRVPYIAAAADGIVTTVQDIGRFLSYITAPPRKGIATLPPSSVPALYQPLIARGDTGYGWRITNIDGDRVIFQGGSVEGFSSRVMIWPERNAGIAILSAQGGIVQSNIVLPLLTSAAEQILFTGSSPKLFPVGRVLVIAGIIVLVYLAGIFFQILTVPSWTKAVFARQETGNRRNYVKFSIVRTGIGIAFRLALFIAVPLAGGMLVGRPIFYHDLFIMEPGLAASFTVAAIAGIMRNISRLVWIRHTMYG